MIKGEGGNMALHEFLQNLYLPDIFFFEVKLVQAKILYEWHYLGDKQDILYYQVVHA